MPSLHPHLTHPLSLRHLALVGPLLSSILTLHSAPNDPPTLTPLPYNHPGLHVDLGVGLWAWPIPCDADHDGDLDLLVSCPDKPSNGIYLFENVTGDTRLQPLPIFKPARRLSGTLHNVMPSYVQGQTRLLSPGTEYLDFTHTGTQVSRPLPIPPRFYKPQGSQKKGPGLRHNLWRYTDFNGDGIQDLIVGVEDWSFYGWDDARNPKGDWTNGPLRGFVHVALGTSSNSFLEPTLIRSTQGAPLETYGCPSPNFEDFDHDGDLDLLCGEFLDGFTYFENIGSRTQPRYIPGRRLQDAHGNPLRMDLQMIAPVALDWDRDGQIDLIVGDEDGRVAFIRNTGRLRRKLPIFEPPVYFQQEADTLKCGALATPVGVDWDGDGDFDIVSGNTAGYIEWFENLSGPGVEQPRWAAPRKIESSGRPFRIQAGPKGSVQGPAEAKWGYTTLSVADWDRDGRLDVIYNSIWGRVQWLRNIGTRSHPRFGRPRDVQVDWDGSAPKPEWVWWTPGKGTLTTQWRTTPVVQDLNRDGWPDLTMLDHQGYLAFFARQPGTRRLSSPRRLFLHDSGQPLRLNSKVAGGSGRRKLSITDWDGDGRFDLLLNSANANLLQQLETAGEGWRFQEKGPLSTRNIEGHDVSPTTVDFNQDGIPDFLGGAEDGRFYYLRNPRTPATNAR